MRTWKSLAYVFLYRTAVSEDPPGERVGHAKRVCSPHTDFVSSGAESRGVCKTLLKTFPSTLMAFFEAVTALSTVFAHRRSVTIFGAVLQGLVDSIGPSFV